MLRVDIESEHEKVAALKESLATLGDRQSINKDIGAWLKRVRTLCALSQEQFSDVMSEDKRIFEKTIYLWETGKSKVPTWIIVKTMALAKIHKVNEPLVKFD